MGCDIHMVVQMQTVEGASWDPAPIHGFGDRDYYLFAALAGVRDKAGIKPIAPPRGLPPMSPPYESEEEGSLTGDLFLCDRWWDGCEYDSEKAADQGRDHRWLGEHSFSYLTLAEIETWSGWALPVQRFGVVSYADYVRWKDSGSNAPPSWSSSVCSHKLTVFAPNEVEMLRDAERRAPALFNYAHHYTVAHWTDPGILTSPGWRAFVQALRALADERGLPHDRIRIVFGFDS